jgi:hypothetical protein
MASRVRTIADISVPAVQESPSARQPPRTLLSTHPDMLVPDVSLLLNVPVRARPSSMQFVPTAEGQESRHRPTYSGPSPVARAALGGLGGLAQGAASSYVQYAMMARIAQNEAESSMRSHQDRSHTGRSDRLAGSDSGTSIAGESRITGQPDVHDTITDASSEQQVETNVDSEPLNNINAQTSTQTEDHERASMQSETVTTSSNPATSDQSHGQGDPAVGDIEVRIRHEGSEFGSGGWEHARPLDGAAHDRDIGLSLFAPSRSSSSMRLGTAVSHSFDLVTSIC